MFGVFKFRGCPESRNAVFQGPGDPTKELTSRSVSARHASKFGEIRATRPNFETVWAPQVPLGALGAHVNCVRIPERARAPKPRAGHALCPVQRAKFQAFAALVGHVPPQGLANGAVPWPRRFQDWAHQPQTTIREARTTPLGAKGRSPFAPPTKNAEPTTTMLKIAPSLARPSKLSTHQDS